MLSIIAKWWIEPGCERQAPCIPYRFGDWVTVRGGEYFFVPSLGFFQRV